MSLLHYRELIAWRKSMALVSRIYALSSEFPGHERFGLTSQIRRAAISVPSNIAEGKVGIQQKNSFTTSQSRTVH